MHMTFILHVCVLGRPGWHVIIYPRELQSIFWVSWNMKMLSWSICCHFGSSCGLSTKWQLVFLPHPPTPLGWSVKGLSNFGGVPLTPNSCGFWSEGGNMMSYYLLIPRGRGVNSIHHIPNEFNMLWHVECHEGPKALNGCRPVKTAVGKRRQNTMMHSPWWMFCMFVSWAGMGDM